MERHADIQQLRVLRALAVTANYNCTLGARTSAQADDGAQAFPFPHDDGGQNLASEQAVLDARCEGVEPLVTQHGDLVVQSAATHRKLDRRTCAKPLEHTSTGTGTASGCILYCSVFPASEHASKPWYFVHPNLYISSTFVSVGLF